MKNIKTLFTMAALSLTLINCAGKPVTIENQTWYADKGELGAFMFNTLNTDVAEIPKDLWDEMRFGMVCTSADTLAEAQEELQELCSFYPGGCDYATAKKIFLILIRAQAIAKAPDFQTALKLAHP